MPVGVDKYRAYCRIILMTLGAYLGGLGLLMPTTWSGVLPGHNSGHNDGHMVTSSVISSVKRAVKRAVK